MHEVISLGAGVQSSVMALMAARGELTPMPELAIFADTQYEPVGVYKHLDWLEKELPFPVQRVTAGDIRADTISGRQITGHRLISLPFFTADGGMSRRQCTHEYKIKPIREALRALTGKEPRQRIPRHLGIRQWSGISRDEATRMKPAPDSWIENCWPLVDVGMSRLDCRVWFEAHYPGRDLPRSACIACPFHSNREWRDLKVHDPASFADAVEFDEQIRTQHNGSSTIKQDLYVHSSRTPLASVDFRNLEDLGQQNFFENECEGMCGV